MITQTPLPYETERLLNSELASGETVLWAGQPRPRLWTGQTIAAILFGIPWTAFSVSWVVLAGSMGSSVGTTSPGYHGPTAPNSFSLIFWIFPLFGLPFVLIGLGMLSLPYWTWRKAKKSIYAVTGKRGLILEANWRGSIVIRSISADQLADRTRTQNRDGSGDLIFTHLTTMSAGSEGGTTTTTVGFKGIPEVKSVDDLISRTFG